MRVVFNVASISGQTWRVLYELGHGEDWWCMADLFADVKRSMPVTMLEPREGSCLKLVCGSIVLELAEEWKGDLVAYAGIREYLYHTKLLPAGQPDVCIELTAVYHQVALEEWAGSLQSVL